MRKLADFQLSEGDIVIGRRGDMGRCAVVTDTEHGWLCGTGSMIIKVKETSDAEFLQRVLSSAPIIAAIENASVGSTMINLNQGTLRQLNISLPTQKKEQTAIANALSDVDALISEQEKLIAKKQAIKTATMQQLLTGRARLPAFALREDGTAKGFKQSELGEVPEDWDVSTIGANTSWLSDGTPSRDNESYWQGSIPWISGSTLKSFELTTSDQFLTEEGVASGSKMAPLNAVLILVRGSALHNEIRAGVVMKPVAFNQDVKALIPSTNLDSRYLTFYIMAMNEELLKLVSSAGNSAGVLDTELVKNFMLFLPTREEQVVIAAVISDLDKDIKLLKNKLRKFSRIKQGMMQELLTGRTRLI